MLENEPEPAMNLGWVFRQIGTYRRYLVQNLFIVILIVVLNFAVPLTNRALINSGVLADDLEFVGLILAIQAVMYSLLISLHYLRSEISSHVSNRLIVRMVGEFIRHAVRLPMSYFNRSSRGDLVERIRDFERIQRFASVELMEFSAAIISLLSLGPLLLWIDPALFVVFAVSAIVYVLWIVAYNKRRRKVDTNRFKADSASRTAEIGIIEAIQDIKIAGLERGCLEEWERVQIDMLHARLNAASIQHWQVAGGNAITRVGLLLISFISARGVITGEITLGDLTITTVIAMQLNFHVQQILEFVTKLQETTGALRRADELRRIEVEGSGRGAGHHIPIRGGISMDDVRFSYPGTHHGALQGLTLAIEEGKVAALAGPSGSGKSTILKLLMKFYAPDHGSIHVGGEDILDVDLFQWRANLSAVMQEGALLAGSIRYNITAGQPLDEAWLDEVVAIARLQEVIAVQPQGLDTRVGPAGERLSAGQAQRVLIARAVYKRPSLLLLDEATSALDTVNEAAILAGIRRALPDTTIIMVAHRLSTIKGADRIFVIERGQVAEQGSHQELMDRHGFYADLVHAYS